MFQIASLPNSVIALIVFAFPAVFQLCGIAGAALLLTAFACLSAYAQSLMLSAAGSVGVTTYEECTKKCLGQWGLVWQTICLAIGPFIANCAHVQAGRGVPYVGPRIYKMDIYNCAHMQAVLLLLTSDWPDAPEQAWP